MKARLIAAVERGHVDWCRYHWCSLCLLVGIVVLILRYWSGFRNRCSQIVELIVGEIANGSEQRTAIELHARIFELW